MVENLKNEYPSESIFCYPTIKLACSRHEGEDTLAAATIIRGCKFTEDNPLPPRWAKYGHRKGSTTWCNKFPCKDIDSTRENYQKMKLAMKMEAIATPAEKRQRLHAEALNEKQQQTPQPGPPKNVWGKEGLVASEAAKPPPNATPRTARQETGGIGATREEILLPTANRFEELEIEEVEVDQSPLPQRESRIGKTPASAPIHAPRLETLAEQLLSGAPASIDAYDKAMEVSS